MVETIAIIGGVLVLGVVAMLIFAATKPNTFRVQRSANMKASPERVFPHINDFHSWTAWSPWEKIDPNLKRTYSGAESGKGAIYEWEGIKKVGKGRMEITASAPPSTINIQLDFIKPFEAHNRTEFTMEPQGDATNVTWAMQGQQPFMFKVMTLFFSMDKMIGKDFEAGLANLKGLVEK